MAEIELCDTALSAARDAEATVVCTAWPEYREVEPKVLRETMRRPLILDPGGHLDATLGSDPTIEYARVGARPR